MTSANQLWPTSLILQFTNVLILICYDRLEDGPVGGEKPWSEQIEIRGTVRSVSHPDLCIVGQGLQREWGK